MRQGGKVEEVVSSSDGERKVGKDATGEGGFMTEVGPVRVSVARNAKFGPSCAD